MVKDPIMIVEDDVDDQFLFKHALKKLELSDRLLLFNNGREALDYLTAQNDQPFIIICDINMPIMNGLELRKKIFEDDFLRKKSIPFVFLSTAARPSEVNLAYNLTVQGFFEKGHSYSEIENTLKRILDYWEKSKHPNSFAEQL